MKAVDFKLVRYDADEGKVFDWKEPRYIIGVEDNEEKEVQEHLYVKTLFIGGNDKIENYVEVAEDGTITELETPDLPTDEDYLAALAELGVK